MTREELRKHCEKQIKMCETWSKAAVVPKGKVYDEHKLILELLDNEPKANVGYWVGSYPRHKVLVNRRGCVIESVVCSECGEWLDGSSEDEECAANFCPNCGAKMEREEVEDKV